MILYGSIHHAWYFYFRIKYIPTLCTRYLANVKTNWEFVGDGVIFQIPNLQYLLMYPLHWEHLRGAFGSWGTGVDTWSVGENI